MTNQTFENRDAAGHILGVKATSRGLIRATLGSIAAALAILVLFWLPSEYGVDSTGLGRVMGLTQMGEIKQQLYTEAADEDAVLAAQAAAERVSADPALLARLDALQGQVAAIAAALGAAPQTSAPEALTPPAAAAIASPTPEQTTPVWRDEVSYTLAPTEGIEVKLVMSEGGRAAFEWTANGAVLNFDTHGDGGGQSVTYEQGRGVPDQSGELVAAFDGNHGWFWRNRTDAPVTFTLRTRGAYDRMIAP
ncbi:transmembrane anchor protein [Pelagibius sp.]|uniref:transmembrane anchor protein n=1 Tax=Pelagibius sp. TaxID=1931238 RepID=UPI003BAEF8B1